MQKPAHVRVNAVDPHANLITIALRDTSRTLPMATMMRVAVDGRKAAFVDMPPGDAVTVVYGKAGHAMVSGDAW